LKIKALSNQVEITLNIATHMVGASIVNIKAANNQLYIVLIVIVHMKGATFVNIKDVPTRL